MLARRSLLQAAVAAASSRARAVRARSALAATASRRLSIADPPTWYGQPADMLQRRFDLYRSLGIGSLRSHIRWSELEVTAGQWTEPRSLSYLRQALRAGFGLRLLVATLSGAPDWFFTANPDARVLDRAGESTRNLISPWYPRLRQLLAEKSDAVFGALARMDLLAQLGAVMVDLGPQGEAIFPAGWGMTATHDHPDPGFWFYDPHARADFLQKMQARYRTPETANRRWGTGLSSWAELQIPEEGSRPGPMWEDLLTWYRDSKRDLIVWQLDNYRTMLAKYSPQRPPPVVVLIPGIHITDGEWSQAIASGRGGKQTHAMTDTNFLIEAAARRGCWLQYDAVGNASEVGYISAYLRAHGFDNPLWGENAGGPSARNPAHLADVVIANQLYGLEYINASEIFGPDTVTPNEVFTEFEAACRRLQVYFASR